MVTKVSSESWVTLTEEGTKIIHTASIVTVGSKQSTVINGSLTVSSSELNITITFIISKVYVSAVATVLTEA